MKLNSIYENSLDNKKILGNLKFKVKDGGFINYDPNKGSYLTLTNKEQLDIDAKDSFNNEISFLLDIYVKYDKKINGSEGTLLQLNLASREEIFKVISKTVNKKVGIYFGTEKINCEVQHSSIVENRWINLTIIKVGENLTLFVNGAKIENTLQLTDWQLNVNEIALLKIILGGSEDNEDVFNYADLSLFEINELKEDNTPAEILEVFKSFGKDYLKNFSNRSLLNKQYSYTLYNTGEVPRHLEQGKGDVKLDISNLQTLFDEAQENITIRLRVKKGVFKLRDKNSIKEVNSITILNENTFTENQLIFDLPKGYKDSILPLQFLELDNLSQQDRVFSELEIVLDGNEEDKIVLFNTTDLIDNRGIETTPFELLILENNELHNHDESDEQKLLFRLINKSDVNITLSKATVSQEDNKLSYGTTFIYKSLSEDVIIWDTEDKTDQDRPDTIPLTKFVHRFIKKSAKHEFEKGYLTYLREEFDFAQEINQTELICPVVSNVKSFQVSSDFTLEPGDYIDFQLSKLRVKENNIFTPSGEYAFELLYQGIKGFRDGILPFKIKTVNVLDNLPIGTILPYTGSKIPRGWLVCDGVAEIKTYRKLQEILGTEKVPNLINRFLYGGEQDNLTMNIEDDIVHIDFADSEKNYEKEDLDQNKNSLQGEPGYGGKDRVRLHHKNLPDHDHSYYYNEFLDKYGDIDERMSINELLLNISCPEKDCDGSLNLSNQCSNEYCIRHEITAGTTEQIQNRNIQLEKYFPVNEVTKAQMNKVVRTTGNTIYSEHHRSHADTDKLLNKSFNIIPPYYRVVYIIKAR